MPEDIQDAIKQMDEIDLNTRPRLHVHFDPIKWLATNPMQNPTVYQLNQDQLKGWGEEATEIRRKILLKAENYESNKAVPQTQSVKVSSRRSVPHSKIEDNPEHLLEVQIRNRARSQAGVRAKYKKRYKKELPAATREAIVKINLEDHVFQGDVAK